MTLSSDVSNLVKWGENEISIVENWVGKEVKAGEDFISKEAAVAWTDLKAFFALVEAETYAQIKPLVLEVIQTAETDLSTLEQNLIMLAEQKAAGLVPILQAMESSAIQAVIAFIMTVVAKVP